MCVSLKESNQKKCAFNPYLLNELSQLKQLDKPISKFRVVRHILSFHFHFELKLMEKNSRDPDQSQWCAESGLGFTATFSSCIYTAFWWS